MKRTRAARRSFHRWPGALAILVLTLAGCSGAAPVAAPPPPAAASREAQAQAPPAAPAAPGAPAAAQEEPPRAAAHVAAQLTVDKAIVLGKWPEGIAVVGDTAWVAESGNRRVARVDLKRGEVTAHVAVGRLPVQVVASPAGVVYTLSHTDQTIWAIDGQTARARALARLPDSPEDMVFADDALWVLLWSKGSSTDSSVVRIDPATGAQRRSPALGRDAFALAVGHGRIWVAHGNGDVSVVDKTSLEPRDDLHIGDLHRRIAAGPGAVFTDVRSGVVRLDPVSGRATHEVALGEPVAVLQQAGDELIAVGQSGRTWLLDPDNLALRAILAAPEGVRSPHAAMRYGEALLLTEFDDAGGAGKADGRLLILRSSPR
ncbi:YncE family protein [Sorangium sp. So ce204]|uniref:YncE family protein n=1 Tax=Sorangium sp. So ce204 TaxID=3133288 RepID=UPI003F633D3F